LTDDPSGYCPEHLKIYRWQADKERGSADARGYDARWRKARTVYLAEHPLCVECLKKGNVVAATTVDHIRPHRGDYGLMWDEKNWQALCTLHHNIKTATEDGAFGNKETRSVPGTR
jgi:5-methylcytosine-specific restriction protein A